jgi:hypothetical protein
MRYFLTKLRNGLLTVICALIFASGITWYAAANFNGTQCSSGCTAFLDFIVSTVHIPGIVMVDAATGATDVGNGILTAVQSAIPAGENHAAEVGGNAITITNALVTSNNTVTTGKAIGPLQTLANAVRVSGAIGASGTSGIVQDVFLSFTDAVAGTSADVYLFNANPTGSTCTDNTTFVLVTADRDKVIRVIHVTDFTSGGTPVTASADNLATVFALASATSMYACVVARGSFAITSTANASLRVAILRN